MSLIQAVDFQRDSELPLRRSNWNESIDLIKLPWALAETLLGVSSSLKYASTVSMRSTRSGAQPIVAA